jgi:hypothetical protein
VIRAANDALGGSALFFSMAARLFAPVGVVAAVGADVRSEDWQLRRWFTMAGRKHAK